MGKPFVRFCEGMRHNWCMAEIMWHRRETRRQTENTNVMPGALEGLILLDRNLDTPFYKQLRAHYPLLIGLSSAMLSSILSLDMSRHGKGRGR
jgi:hypothetical protein